MPVRAIAEDEYSKGCDDVRRASQLEIMDLKALHQADQVLLKEVQDERDKAYRQADMALAPMVPWFMWLVLGAVAGGAIVLTTAR